MKNNSNKVKNSDKLKIRKIGGRFEQTYRLVLFKLIDIDEDYLQPFLRLRGEDKSLESYLSFVLNQYEVKKAYVEKYVEDNRGSGVSDHYLRKVGGMNYDKEIGVRSLTPLRKLPRYVEEFREALEFSREVGLTLNYKKFLELYTNYSNAERMELAQTHREIVGLINSFFAIPITEEELRRYFRIEGGRIEIPPTGATEEAYLRLSNRGVGKYCNTIIPGREEIE